MEELGELGRASVEASRIIKRYSNRKLYDTRESRYVTLLQIAEFVREGDEVRIIDNSTKEDLTQVTLAQIVVEEQKAKERGVPLHALRELLHSRTQSVLSELKDTSLGRLIDGDVGPSKLVDQAKETLESWQHKIDERIRMILPNSRPIAQLQAELEELRSRVNELEKASPRDHA